MFHDFGAQKWNISTPQEYEEFCKKANVTLIFKTESQRLGHEVVGNDLIDKGLIGVKAEPQMNVHVDHLVTKRVIGIPVGWKNLT